MKIIFDLIDVSFGKNHFFEQFLTNHLWYFISDSVIISCIFIEEPNFNLYSICLFTENVIWKKMPIYLQPNFRPSTLQRVRNVNTAEFFYHPCFVRANIIYPPYQSCLLAFSPSLWCVVFCFWAHGLPVVIQIWMTTPSVLMGSCLPDKQLTVVLRLCLPIGANWNCFGQTTFYTGVLKIHSGVGEGVWHVLFLHAGGNVGQCSLWLWAACGSPGNISPGFSLNVVYTRPLISFTKSCQSNGISSTLQATPPSPPPGGQHRSWASSGRNGQTGNQVQRQHYLGTC